MSAVRGEIERLLTPAEAAELLSVPRSWLYNRHAAGTLPFPAVKVGHYLRFRAADVLAFIDRQAGATTRAKLREVR